MHKREKHGRRAKEEEKGGRLIFTKNTAFPSPRPCTLLFTNKRVLYTNQRPPAVSAEQPVGFLEDEQHTKMATDVW